MLATTFELVLHLDRFCGVCCKNLHLSELCYITVLNITHITLFNITHVTLHSITLITLLNITQYPVKFMSTHDQQETLCVILRLGVIDCSFAFVCSLEATGGCGWCYICGCWKFCPRVGDCSYRSLHR